MADLLPERTLQTGIQAIRLRSLKTIGEMDQVVDLEEQIWGYGAPGSDPPYPARALFAIAESGGQVAGAFADGDLVGFALAWLGSENGTRVPYLHSQLMGVLPDYRSHGIGYHLKLFQRDYALGSGLELIKWTFDPLLAANAHLNLKKLGSVIRSYIPNYYGNLQSRFTRGIASDRVWVSWFVKSQRVQGRIGRSTLATSMDAGLPRATRVQPDPISGLARLTGFRLDLDPIRAAGRGARRLRHASENGAEAGSRMAAEDPGHLRPLPEQGLLRLGFLLHGWPERLSAGSFTAVPGPEFRIEPIDHGPGT